MTLRRLLAVLLVAWEPLSLALTAAAVLDRLGDRGWPAMVLLVLRLGVTGFGVAAGRALWSNRDGAITLARWGTGLALAAAAITLLTDVWPSSRPPGLRGPVAAVLLAWYAAWFLWTLRQRDAPPPAATARSCRM
jgi:hypothetical protein